MAYPPTNLPNDIGNIFPNKDFNLKDFNDRFSDIKNYVESLKDGIDADKTDISNLASNKVDKINNCGLSKNDFTDSYKSTLDNLSTTLNNYVLKDGNKVLSDNNFNSTYKGLLDNLYNSSNTSKNGHTHTFPREITSTSENIWMGDSPSSSGSYTFTISLPNGVEHILAAREVSNAQYIVVTNIGTPTYSGSLFSRKVSIPVNISRHYGGTGQYDCRMYVYYYNPN